jgi:hypothetical protein
LLLESTRSKHPAQYPPSSPSVRSVNASSVMINLRHS